MVLSDETVYKTALQVGKDVFDPRRMNKGIRRILHEDTIDIDEPVAFLKGKGTAREVSSPYRDPLHPISDELHIPELISVAGALTI